MMKRVLARTFRRPVQVDVIVPVHNAATTIEDAVRSAMHQEIPDHLQHHLKEFKISIAVCCYNDGSTDESWSILEKLSKHFSKTTPNSDDDDNTTKISSRLLTQQSQEGKGRGAGYARNRAIDLNDNNTGPSCDADNLHRFLCLLDSDDTMHPHRVAEQTHYMLQLTPEERKICLLGGNFDRDPPDSTWHYSAWANSLSDERLHLEQFREVSILQPTWFLCRSRWAELGGYIEAPALDSTTIVSNVIQEDKGKYQRLIHPVHDTPASLKLAEDLRFFHQHLQAGGILRLHRTATPLVTYRHTGTSQSFRTSRRLLLQLRVLAMEQSILQKDWLNESVDDDRRRFIVWGAGRDGKEFIKALDAEYRKRIYCLVDVDAKKLKTGRYMNKDLNLDIPIVHFSFLIKNAALREKIQREWEEGTSNDSVDGRIDKSRNVEGIKEANATPDPKRRKLACSTELDIRGLSAEMLQTLPVVVCVAMYRTNGVLEKNIKTVGRTEGQNLWHFS